MNRQVRDDDRIIFVTWLQPRSKIAPFKLISVYLRSSLDNILLLDTRLYFVSLGMTAIVDFWPKLNTNSRAFASKYLPTARQSGDDRWPLTTSRIQTDVGPHPNSDNLQRRGFQTSILFPGFQLSCCYICSDFPLLTSLVITI